MSPSDDSALFLAAGLGGSAGLLKKPDATGFAFFSSTAAAVSAPPAEDDEAASGAGLGGRVGAACFLGAALAGRKGLNALAF